MDKKEIMTRDELKAALDRISKGKRSRGRRSIKNIFASILARLHLRNSK